MKCVITVALLATVAICRSRVIYSKIAHIFQQYIQLKQRVPSAGFNYTTPRWPSSFFESIHLKSCISLLSRVGYEAHQWLTLTWQAIIIGKECSILSQSVTSHTTSLDRSAGYSSEYISLSGMRPEGWMELHMKGYWDHADYTKVFVFPNRDKIRSEWWAFFWLHPWST